MELGELLAGAGLTAGLLWARLDEGVVAEVALLGGVHAQLQLRF